MSEFERAHWAEGPRLLCEARIQARSENGANGPSIPKCTWRSARIDGMRFGTIPVERILYARKTRAAMAFSPESLRTWR